MHTKQKRQLNDKKEITLPFLIKRCFIFVLLFFIIGFLFALFLSLLFFRSGDPTSKISLVGYISLYTSVALTTFIFKRGLKEKKLLGGLILGSMIFVFTYLISLTLGQKENGATELLLRLGIVLICFTVCIIPKITKNKVKKFKRH